MRDTDEQYTPKWIFDALNVEFDLDVCAPKGGVDYIPAKKHYSIEDNALMQNWEGFVWMNPPFSKAVFGMTNLLFMEMAFVCVQCLNQLGSMIYGINLMLAL